jgi:hypothetical protein
MLGAQCTLRAVAHSSGCRSCHAVCFKRRLVSGGGSLKHILSSEGCSLPSLLSWTFLHHCSHSPLPPSCHHCCSTCDPPHEQLLMRLGVVCHLLLLSLSVIIGWCCQPYFSIVSPHCSLFLPYKQLLTVVVGGCPHCLELPGHCCVCVCRLCHCPHHVPVSASISISIPISISIHCAPSTVVISTI